MTAGRIEWTKKSRTDPQSNRFETQNGPRTISTFDQGLMKMIPHRPQLTFVNGNWLESTSIRKEVSRIYDDENSNKHCTCAEEAKGNQAVPVTFHYGLTYACLASTLRPTMQRSFPSALLTTDSPPSLHV